MRSHKHRLQRGKCLLDVRKKFFAMRMFKHWNRCLRGLWDLQNPIERDPEPPAVTTLAFSRGLGNMMSGGAFQPLGL